MWEVEVMPGSARVARTINSNRPDLFGRVLEQKWTGAAVQDHFSLAAEGYDANGNPLYRKNEVAGTAGKKFDEGGNGGGMGSGGNGVRASLVISD